MERNADTGISILVVGAGIAGLTFAIEAYRKGHTVRVIDRREQAKDFGELIVISAPALRTPAKWPGFLEKAQAYALDPVSDLFKFDGTHILQTPVAPPNTPVLVIYRSKLHQVLYDYACNLGISIKFSNTAVEYTETLNSASVKVADKLKETADLVVAADGVGTCSWRLVLGEKEAPISSGFALYRVTLPVETVLENPELAKVLKEPRTYFCTYAGPDAHIVIGKAEKEICWMLTHKDEGDSKESWTNTVPAAHALECVKNWGSFPVELVKSTPDDRVLSWKLMWRDPQPKWVSPLGRVVQIGDAAHPFLPTSGSGATMAMEDAISLASCLSKGGKDMISLSLKVHNKLRFERVSCAQKLGFKTREVLHKTDWDLVAKHPEIMSKRLGGWLTTHDPEEYALQNFQHCASSLVTEAQFSNTNAVPGYSYKPWTVRELLDASEKGEHVEDEGDWF